MNGLDVYSWAKGAKKCTGEEGGEMGRRVLGRFGIEFGASGVQRADEGSG